MAIAISVLSYSNATEVSHNFTLFLLHVLFYRSQHQQILS